MALCGIQELFPPVLSCTFPPVVSAGTQWICEEVPEFSMWPSPFQYPALQILFFSTLASAYSQLLLLNLDSSKPCLNFPSLGCGLEILSRLWAVQTFPISQGSQRFVVWCPLSCVDFWFLSGRKSVLALLLCSFNVESEGGEGYH